MITYTETINDFYELRERVWGGAEYTLDTIEENGCEDELMQLLMQYDWNDLTDINDFLHHESDFVLDMLGCNEENEEEGEE